MRQSAIGFQLSATGWKTSRRFFLAETLTCEAAAKEPGAAVAVAKIIVARGAFQAAATAPVLGVALLRRKLLTRDKSGVAIAALLLASAGTPPAATAPLGFDVIPGELGGDGGDAGARDGLDRFPTRRGCGEFRRQVAQRRECPLADPLRPGRVAHPLQMQCDAEARPNDLVSTLPRGVGKSTLGKSRGSHSAA